MSSLRALVLGTISSAVVVAVAACGGSGAAPGHHAGHARRHLVATPPAAPRPVNLSYHELYSLPAPVQDPAAADLGAGRFVLLGGLTAADTSSAGVTVADLRGPVHSSTLPGPQHDAAAAALGGEVYVFGGADFNQYDHILNFDPSLDSVGSAGTLPSLASDVAATETGGTAYVVGGFDGSNWLDTIVAWRPGAPARVVAHLPIALRYAAVTSVAGKILIIGGSTPSGASNAIFSFDPATGTAHQIGRLAHPITHAGAATLGSTVYVVGGRGDLLDSQTADVWAIDPVTGAVHLAGRLPQPLSDAGLLSSGDAIIVAGGRSPTATQAAVGELVPAAAG